MMHFTLGIAGHIDHGKTTLAQKLTGIQTDRLKEEKERNISIETGFAHFQLPNGEVVGVVDVPGHERFIRQMIAGSTGIDMVLLVIAANEGVMPQTREHLDILELLGVKKGIVVINKIDLVDEEFLVLAIEDARALVQGTFLDNAPIVPLSSRTGMGIPMLIDEITNALAVIPGRHSDEPFRLPIDRSFTIKGSGTVVTGTVFEGKIQVGDQLRLLPQNKAVRVRGIQVHHQAVETAFAGQRAAINLTGVEHDQIKRGDVLLVPDFLEMSTRIDLELHALSSIEYPLKHRSRVAVYSGTAEVEGIVLFFDRTALQPGETTYAQVVLEEAMVVKRGDPILVRRPTPALTIGGGTVITPYGQKYPFRAETAERMKRQRYASVKELILMHLQTREMRLHQLQKELTIPFSILKDSVIELMEEGVLVRLSNDQEIALDHVIANKEYIIECEEHLLALLQDYHRKYPSQQGMKRSECRASLHAWSEEMFAAVIAALIRVGKLRGIGERLVLADFLPQLPAQIAPQAEKILQQLEDEGREVTDWNTMVESVGLTPKQAAEIRRFYIEQGYIVALTDKIVWTTTTWEQAVQQLRAHCTETTISIAAVKEVLGLSRKYIIPFLERLDQQGITKRIGEVRTWQI